MTASTNKLLSDLDEADRNLSAMVSPGGATVASKAVALPSTKSFSAPPPPPSSSPPPPPPGSGSSPQKSDAVADVPAAAGGEVAPPASLEEAISVFREFASFYDVDLQREPHLLQIIQEASAAVLPEGWEEVEKGEEVYFYNESTNDSTWDHPLDGPTRAAIQAEREKHTAAGGGGNAVVGYVSHSTPDLAAAAKDTGRLSHQDVLTLPTTKEGSGGELHSQASTEQVRRVTAELESVTRGRDAETRERELLKDMVEQVRMQLADVRAESKTQRESIAGLEKSRQELWTKNIELQGRLTGAEGDAREAERERDRLAEKVTELGRLVVAAQTKLVVVEKELATDKTAASYESAEKRRAQEGFHELMERQGTLLSRVQELEAALDLERNGATQARAQAEAARQHAEYVQQEAGRSRHRSKNSTKRVEMGRPATAELLARPTTASYEVGPIGPPAHRCSLCAGRVLPETLWLCSPPKHAHTHSRARAHHV